MLTIQIQQDARLIKAVVILNAMIRDRLKEFEGLCKKYPQFSQITELPEGHISKGGLLQEVELLTWMLNPAGDGKSLVDALKPELPLATSAPSAINVYISEPVWINGAKVAEPSRGEEG